MINIRKKTLALSVVIACLSACQSTTPYTPTTVTNVVEVNQTQKELYDKSRQWFSEYFVSGESVIDYEDPSTGTIIGNGIANIGTDTFGIIKYGINYSIRVDTKDGKFKTEYKIVKHTNSDSTNGTYDVVNVSQERINLAKQEVEKITASLDDYIRQSGSDW